jgi:hypothetical protein
VELGKYWAATIWAIGRCLVLLGKLLGFLGNWSSICEKLELGSLGLQDISTIIIWKIGPMTYYDASWGNNRYVSGPECIYYHCV